MVNALRRFERLRPFTEAEAWNLFRTAAIAEACGWTLLITGIVLETYVLHGNRTPVLLTGQIHGLIFSLYLVAAIMVYPSLGWSRRRTIIAVLASVPPYGTLLFEQWAAYKRRHEALKNYRKLAVYGLIVRKGQLLVVQPKDRGNYRLPGGEVMGGETAEQALERLIRLQTGVKPDCGRLVAIVQTRRKATEGIELYFLVTNAERYVEENLIHDTSASRTVDAVEYLNPTQTSALEPAFLCEDGFLVQFDGQTGPMMVIDRSMGK